MNPMRRERAAWIAVTVVLSVALAWTALLVAALAFGACAHCPPGIAVASRALLRGLGLALRAGGPPALAATLAAALLAGLLLRGGPRPEGVRHGG